MTGYKGKIKPEAAVALAEFTDIYRDKRESIDDAIDRAIADARIHATVANLYYRAIRPGGMYNALADAQDILRGIGMVRGPILEDINKLMELAAKLPDKYKQPAKLEVPEIE
jgi:hypothetical protein